MNISPEKLNAILASAYNVCGPRSGEAATPANVHQLAGRTLPALAREYAAHVASDPDALFTAAEVAEAARIVARRSGGTLGMQARLRAHMAAAGRV